jgi:hypothetical protein
MRPGVLAVIDNGAHAGSLFAVNRKGTALANIAPKK